ncbi:hypothetical protein [Bacteriovorax sp. Seq25_V]|uniref:hypothetical protein n=1 Tax=Bacteriovorax sp. Seq25_V TaxID=1201288 RepID=UPI00038A14FF|nr:hypothetical protein [Bacteriovorax sp. Seq25_V]EQC44768.1 hypothetical protein M900_0382 [Bacteriovorax sp. Seq25_V]
MKYLIVLLFNFLCFAECLSFKVQKLDSFEIDLKDKKELSLIKIQIDGKKIEGWFFCALTRSKYSCKGDDDSGEFSIQKKKDGSSLLEIKHLKVGQPDGLSYTFQNTREKYRGRSCN